VIGGGGQVLASGRFFDCSGCPYLADSFVVLATMVKQKKIMPFLWFNDQAEEAAKFYVSVFKNSKVLGINHYPPESPGKEGSVMTVKFELDGEEIVALNGGPHFTLSEAFSFWVKCDTQEEIDYFWEKLSEGGKTSECGWLKDKFGLSWQIVPSSIEEWISEEDPERKNRVLKAVWQMQKLDLKTLQEAYRGA
jgi:predicted 3-demethylubiquinone-9 3-methyltransferase (glyoxalase superfamily)